MSRSPAVLFEIQKSAFFPGNAIGIPESEFSKVKELEVLTFRRNILAVCQAAMKEREAGAKGQLGQALYCYPPVTHETAELPPHLAQRVETGTCMVVLWCCGDVVCARV